MVFLSSHYRYLKIVIKGALEKGQALDICQYNDMLDSNWNDWIKFFSVFATDGSSQETSTTVEESSGEQSEEQSQVEIVAQVEAQKQTK
ncbi:MAG: hypothetical protein KBT36_09180 [Kurthia sp.]|nr:hypothetical protein [Candidatus Kurthia equi]